MHEATLSTEDISDTYTVILSHEAEALACARGPYQVDLLHGTEAWSGSTLSAKARKHGSSYHKSRMSLLQRLTDAGIPHCEVTGPHNRRIVVIGASKARIKGAA
jgi:hypothetical protein